MVSCQAVNKSIHMPQFHRSSRLQVEKLLSNKVPFFLPHFCPGLGSIGISGSATMT
jgi:hypothetical protein